MKTLILAALAALTFVLGGCAASGDLLGTGADSSFPVGSYSATPE